MNHRALSLMTAAAMALPMTAVAQTAGGSAAQSAQSNLAQYGTQTPVVAGAGAGNAGAAGGIATGTPQPAGPGNTGVVGAGVAPSVPAGPGSAPLAQSSTRTSGSRETGATGGETVTGTTQGCGTMSSAVGVSPSQLPGNCVP